MYVECRVSMHCVGHFTVYCLTPSNPPMYWSGPSSCVWLVPNTVDSMDD